MSNRLYNQFSYSPERQPVSLMGGFTQVSTPIQASLSNQNITYVAKASGIGGNDITIRLIAPGINGPLAISVVGTAIVVTLARSTTITTTADDLISALSSDNDVLALISVQTSPGGSNIITALATTHLSGGVNGVLSSNALNMSMAQAADTYTVTFQDEFPEVLSAQVSLLIADPVAESASVAFKSIDTAFGSSKTAVILITNGTANGLAVNDRIFLHFIFRNSSNPTL